MLGKNDKRSEYFADSQGLWNSIRLETKTKKGTTGNKLFNAREGNNLIRSAKSLAEGCCGTSLSPKRPISKQYIQSEKEGLGQQTCDTLEGVKPIPFFPKFRNGEFTIAENSLAKKRVHVQTRRQGRIVMCSTFSGQPKESDVCEVNDYSPSTEKITINKMCQNLYQDLVTMSVLGHLTSIYQ